MTAALPDWNAAVQSTNHIGNFSIRNIVLPLDHSDESLVALPVARALADLYSATLHVTNVGPGSFSKKDRTARLGLSSEEAPGTVFEEAEKNAAEVITRLAHELPEALIVMCTAIGARAQNHRFGWLTEAVFETRPERAVLLTPERGNRPWRFRRILLAHDGTPLSNPATGPAADLAQRAGAEVTALHVAARGEERPDAPGSIPAPFYVDQPQHEWPDWAEEFMNRVVAGGAPPSGIHFKLSVTGGQAGSELAQAAREHNSDLVVMAWHGHWEHEDCATRVVIRNAGCPVLLVYSGS